MAFSPDGRHLVYVGSDHNTSQLYLRPVDRQEASPIPGTDGGLGPFFSPDGEWVGFWADGELKKVSVRGGPSVGLCETGRLFGASWGPDDHIVFAGLSGGLLRVSADGGTPEVITALDTANRQQSHRLPYVLPGGEAVLFTVRDQLIGGWERSAGSRSNPW
jgi:serine/threonine-protein kinase